MHQFVTYYNHQHRHRVIRYVTPNDLHTGKDPQNLTAHNKVYQAARTANPSRWPSRKNQELCPNHRSNTQLHEKELTPTSRVNKKLCQLP